ncbi:MAG: hypothetical protein ACTSYL_01030 [Candidatus Thorarchaeota archaeon]
MLSPLWVMPLSAPMVSDVVVVMHHDRAVNTAVHTITANDPQVQVVEYGSLEYALTIHRTVGRVVWVSHGSEDGILAGTDIIPWRSFGRVLDVHPGLDLVLACDSEAVRAYTRSSSKVLTFNTVVDAVIGGILASYFYLSSTSQNRGAPSTSARDRVRGTVDVLAVADEGINLIIRQALTRAARIAVGTEQPLFLYLSEVEEAYWTAISVLVILGKLLNIYAMETAPVSGYSPLERLVVMLCSNFMVTGVVEIADTLLYLFFGAIDVVTAAVRIVSGLVEIAGVFMETLYAWFGTLPLWERLAYGVILGASILEFFAELAGSAGTSTVYKLAVILLALTPIMLNLYNDWVDPDPEVG